MDYYSKDVSYDTIIQNLNKVHNELSKKYNRFIIILSMIWIALSGLISFLIFMEDKNAAFYVPFGFTPILILATVLITKSVLKVTIKNNYLNKEVIDLYNFTEGTNIQYEVRPSFDKSFNKEMAIYNRYATPSCKYKLYSDSPNQTNYELMRVRLTTSSGKSTTIHFDGLYLILNVKTNQHFHIKDRKQRRNRKNLKFYNIEDEEFNIYLSEEDYDKDEKSIIRPLDRQFVSLYSYAKEVFDTDKISIGSNKDQIHIAISEKVKFNVPKEFNYENIKTYYDAFTNYIISINQIIEYVDSQDFYY